MKKCAEKHPEKVTNNNVNGETSNIINNNDNKGTINNNITNIKIVINPFLSEDMSKLTDKQKVNILKKCYMSIPELIRQINFNPNIPENHNMYISDMKSKYGHINNGKKWIIAKVDQLVNDVINKKKDDIEDLLEEFVDELPEKVIDKIRDVIASLEYDPLSEEIKDKEKINFKKRIIDEVKIMLYNNKDIAIETRKANDMQNKKNKN
jgi:hypothetical protein